MKVDGDGLRGCCANINMAWARGRKIGGGGRQNGSAVGRALVRSRGHTSGIWAEVWLDRGRQGGRGWSLLLSQSRSPRFANWGKQRHQHISAFGRIEPRAVSSTPCPFSASLPRLSVLVVRPQSTGWTRIKVSSPQLPSIPSPVPISCSSSRPASVTHRPSLPLGLHTVLRLQPTSQPTPPPKHHQTPTNTPSTHTQPPS